MKPIQLQLLESLGSGVRPVDPSAAAEPVPTGQLDRFASMLDDARNGRVRTELGIRFSPAVSGVYTTDQQALIARGVDLAAAAGSEHALILHDQHALRVDVRNRFVLGSTPIDSNELITEIDSFIHVSSPQQHTSSEDEEEEAPETEPILDAVIIPARVVRNASLMHALGGASNQPDSSSHRSASLTE